MITRIDSSLLMEILDETPSTQNIMLVGKHGIGKSQILEKFYSKKGCIVVPLFLGQMSDPGDLIGIPHKNEETGKTEFMPPYWFPTDGKPVVLFLDELNRARPEVLQTIMDLALNRKLAGHALPEGSRIISAVNGGEEYQLTDLDPALVSRFNVYEFVPSVKDWLLWAQENDIDQRIIDFIGMNINCLDNHKSIEDMDNLEKTPDRRSWHRVSEMIKGKDELKKSYRVILSGIIGGVAANKFCEFLSQSHNLTGRELLLGTFEKNRSLLNSYDVPILASLNDSIFLFLESENYEKSQKQVMGNNLNNYFSYLEGKNLREPMAHFANMFTSSSYPNALMFIIEECDQLYNKMTRFVSSIK